MSKTDIDAEILEKKAKEELKIKNYEAAIEILRGAKSIYLELNYMGKVGIIDKQISQLKKVIEYEKKSNVKQKEDIKIAEKSKILVEKPKYDEYRERIIQDSGKNRSISEAELRKIKIREQMQQKEKKEESLKVREDKVEANKDQELQKQIDFHIEEKEKREDIIAARLKKLPTDLKMIMEKIKMINEKAEKELQANLFQRVLNRYQYILELYKSIPNDQLDLSFEIEEVNKRIIDLKSKV